MDVTADIEAAENIKNSLKHLQKLRVSLQSLFDNLGNGPSEGQENQAYLRGIQQRLITMDNAFTELENAGNSLPSNNPPQSINTMALSLEPENESFESFHNVLNSYTWTKRMQEYSMCASSLLRDNQLKRTGPSNGLMAKRNKREVHNLPPTHVDGIISRLKTSLEHKHQDTKLDYYRPLGDSTVLVLTIEKMMKVIIVFRGLLPERILAKGFAESTSLDNGQVDIWSGSKHKVFQLVSQHAQSAMLHFNNPLCPDLNLYHLVNWLHTYKDLFTAECQYCNKILNNGLPPTARGFDKATAPAKYHPQCASSAAR